jgi:hypothetical protein
MRISRIAGTISDIMVMIFFLRKVIFDVASESFNTKSRMKIIQIPIPNVSSKELVLFKSSRIKSKSQTKPKIIRGTSVILIIVLSSLFFSDFSFFSNDFSIYRYFYFNTLTIFQIFLTPALNGEPEKSTRSL